MDKEKVYELALLGLKNSDIAKAMNVTAAAFSKKLDADPELYDSLNRGKCEADGKVVKSLYKAAVGYSVPDVHISNIKGVVTLTPFLKSIPPNVEAAKFWLKNRHPELWSDSQDLNLNGIKELNDLSDEELEKRKESLMNHLRVISK